MAPCLSPRPDPSSMARIRGTRRQVLKLASRWLPLLLLLLPLLACGRSHGSGHRWTLPCHPTVSQAAADRLRERLQPLIRAEGPSEFTLQATADEVTSLVVDILEEHPGETFVEEPRICFAPGRVYIAARLTRVSPFTVEAMVAAEPRLRERRLDIQIVQASVESASLPDALLRALSRTATESLAESLANVHFSEIEVGEGQITISGQRR